MSVRLMGAVFDLRIPATEKLVLLAMADHARDDGTGCYPSVGTLANKTSQSRRGVQGIMRRLEQSGLIVPSKVSRGRRSTEYRIVLDNREPGSLFDQPQPRTPQHSTANLTASNREPGSPEPLRIVKEPKKTLHPAPAAPPDLRHRECVEHASKTFEAKHHQKPTWRSKDFASLKALLDLKPNLGLLEFGRRWGNFLASTEDFTVSQGDSLLYFCNNFDRFLEGPVQRRNGNGTPVSKHEDRQRRTLEATRRASA